jgi:hypothetical protein
MVGASLGFCLGMSLSVSFLFFGLPAWLGLYCGLLMAAGGATLGAFAGQPDGDGAIVALWCIGSSCVVGAVAFLAGFFGPIYLSPGSNQGPLLGIFVTGPYGFVIGALAGLFIGLAKARHSRRMHDGGSQR